MLPIPKILIKGTAVIFNNKAAFTIFLILLLIGSLGCLGVTYYLHFHVTDELQRKHIQEDILPYLLIPTAFLIMMFISQIETTANTYLDNQLAHLRVERVEIESKIASKTEPDIFQTIKLSLNELNQYYTINKAQATTSFRFSCMAIVAGLIMIITGIILNYTGTKTIEVTYLAGISGILLQFIGGAFFFMYKKSLEQVNFFFGQLIKVQDTMLAINLTEGIKEESKKSDMQEKIIISLLERSLK